MPPKFMLAALRLENDSKHGSFLESLRVSEKSITVMTSSFNPFTFSTEGFKGGGKDFKICASDIHIVERLGAGASSIVFKAVLTKERKFVAVKKINVFERDTRRQMIADINALSKLSEHSSPNLVSFYGAYHAPDAGQISIVLEYMDGGSLGDIISKGKIPENVLSKITSQMLEGLHFLHHKAMMVHRDLKPENILLNLDGVAKITDFGISTFIASTLAKCSTFLGTVPYMSPERLDNNKYSFAADIWAVGVMLIEAATGKYPYCQEAGAFDLMIEVMKDEVPLQNPSEFSSEFQDFVTLCLKKDPAKRPTAQQLLCHPFIRKYEGDPVSVREFVRKVHDVDDLLSM